VPKRSGSRPVILPSRFANFNCFSSRTLVYFYYKISVFETAIVKGRNRKVTVTNIKTVLQIRTRENNVGIVSFHLFGVWWRLSKGIVNFVDMISFLININQWLKRSNVLSNK
jgi:hypothetical protein